MTMTREEYLEFLFAEHLKVIKKEQKNAEPGSQVVFYGTFGRAIYTRQPDGTWERTIKPIRV